MGRVGQRLPGGGCLLSSPIVAKLIKVFSTRVDVWTKSYCVTIEMKPLPPYLYMVLFVLQHIAK